MPDLQEIDTLLTDYNFMAFILWSLSLYLMSNVVLDLGTGTFSKLA